MIPRALDLAATDPALHGRQLAVYVVLHSHLDYLSYRPVKLDWLARRLRYDRANVSRAIASLLDRGYLDRGPDDGAIRTYRLTVSPKTRGVVTGATPPAA